MIFPLAFFCYVNYNVNIEVVESGINEHKNPTEKAVSGMTGEYQHTLDAKGRLFIPAKLRDELGGIFFVTVSPEECLSAYSAESWNELSDKVNGMPYSKQRKMRPIFAYATKCELDGQGRILLPQNLREFAKLTKNVTVVGNNNHAEFWDAGNWIKVHKEEVTPENIMSVMEELDF